MLDPEVDCFAVVVGAAVVVDFTTVPDPDPTIEACVKSYCC